MAETLGKFRSQAVLYVPVLCYLLATAYTNHCGFDEPTGDEPFYLLAAQSIVEDGDIDLKNNHEKRGTNPVATHCIKREHGWFLVHNPGLSALIALPWAAGGPIGARLAMALCAGLAAPVVFRVINAIWREPRGSLAITLSLALGMPLVHASSQIYPDLLAGVLLLFLVGRAIMAEADPPVTSWHDLLAPAAFALLPWLHMKYVGPALVVLGWQALARHWRRSLFDAAALGASIAMLAWYYWYAFGKASGPYDPKGALSASLNSFIVFMGLHFDQSQGMFLQQPLWLLGLVGLAPMWRGSRRICLCWMLLYLITIVPNAMHPCWYGGHCYIGRFGATAMLLWAVPLAFAARSLFASHARAPNVVAVAALGLQLCLARNWLTAGEGLLYPWDRSEFFRPCVWSYNGFIPPLLKDYFPYWQPFVEFWHDPANFAALIAACGLPIFGFYYVRRRRLAWACLLGPLSLSAALLAAAPAKTSSAVGTGDKLVHWGCETGRTIENVLVAVEGVDSKGVMGLAYRFFASPGDYQVVLDYLANGTADPVGSICFDDGKTTTTLATLNGEGIKQSVSLLHVPYVETGKSPTVKVMFSGHGILAAVRLSIEPRR